MMPDTSSEAADPITKSDPIVVVGAGIFGLSTAIHLLQRGYEDVTIFDKQPYEQTRYSYFEGCDAASADTNKIFRSAYGSQTEYQSLSTEALTAWRRWNDELASSAASTLPTGLSNNDKIFINNGNLSLTSHSQLPDFEIATINNMEAAGHHDTQLITTDPRHVKLAEQIEMDFAIDPFHRKEREKNYLGVLDTTGGMLNAAKACVFALQKARTLGAKLIFGERRGQFRSFIYGCSPSDHPEVIGIKTLDGKEHLAARVIVACGGYTPSLIPRLSDDGLCETTAGSVAMLKIPRHSVLWDRLSPDRFPTYTWDVREGRSGGIYGFPRDEEGWLKIGYRGEKYTNPKAVPEANRDGDEGVERGKGERSVPVTRYTEEKVEGIPRQAFNVIQGFLDEYLPELREGGIEISVTRLCWYTDSFDNHFVVDYVPDHPNVMIATGGSGHAFKYLPVIGGYVVDVMEEVGCERDVVGKWKWRSPGEGEQVVNLLMEGSRGAKALRNVDTVRVKEVDGGGEGGRARL